jgi:hypothetical protein
MQIQEFINAIEDDVFLFEEKWKKGQISEKDCFPDEMPIEDWYEQFLAFVS